MLDHHSLALTTCLMICSGSAALAQNRPITIAVDATDAPRGIFHSTITFPADPGPLTLYYPKWIPGEHGPTGPVHELTGVVLTAAGSALPWRRDLFDMHAIHCDVPASAESVTVELDYLSPASTEGFTESAGATARLAVIDWHLMLLYAAGKSAREQIYAASLELPPDWNCGGALEIERRDRATIHFKPVTLEALVDTPMVIGRHHRTIDLTPGSPVAHSIEMVADSEAALAIPPAREAAYRKLIAESKALFGHRHYDRYRFLLSMSDHLSHFGLEHHQTSDNRVKERFFIDEQIYEKGDGLLSHEYVHSWCGKYRRPAGLATPDYDQPMTDDLLWVYEGLTSYLGEVLAARSGLYTREGFLDVLAVIASNMMIPGRTWRSLQDTCDAAQDLYEASDAWSSWRRGVDFYDEGVLLWLEIDVTIRAQTGGKRSLDDFCLAFLGGEADGPPEVRPYTFDDIASGLNAVAPFDWKKHLTQRLTSLDAGAPLGGIEAGGWKLVFTDVPNPRFEDDEGEEAVYNMRFSLGLELDEDGKIIDVVRGSPADRVGLAPGMSVFGINDRKLSPDRLRDAMTAAKEPDRAIELLIENKEFFSTLEIEYHGGERYPHVVRDESKPDVLGEIIKSRSGS